MKIKSLNKYKMLFMIITVCLLSGCMYPGGSEPNKTAASKENVQMVQNAVEQYQQQIGLLPIKNSEENTPVYEKFKLDFQALQQRGFLGNVPPNAFENGGTNQYLIINEETKPEVKLLDLLSFQKAVEVQQQVNSYKLNSGNLPFGESISDGFYLLDFAKMNKSDPEVQHLYAPGPMTFIIHESGIVGYDYASAIMKLIQQSGQSDYDDNDDLRVLLTDNYMFVPVKSFPYYWENNEPRLKTME